MAGSFHGVMTSNRTGSGAAKRNSAMPEALRLSACMVLVHTAARIWQVTSGNGVRIGMMQITGNQRQRTTHQGPRPAIGACCAAGAGALLQSRQLPLCLPAQQRARPPGQQRWVPLRQDMKITACFFTALQRFQVGAKRPKILGGIGENRERRVRRHEDQYMIGCGPRLMVGYCKLRFLSREIAWLRFTKPGCFFEMTGLVGGSRA